MAFQFKPSFILEMIFQTYKNLTISFLGKQPIISLPFLEQKSKELIAEQKTIQLK